VELLFCLLVAGGVVVGVMAILDRRIKRRQNSAEAHRGFEVKVTGETPVVRKIDDHGPRPC